MTGREAVLSVGGEIDMAAAARVFAAVEKACSLGPDGVVIEGSGVTFVDASGLRGLLGEYQPAVLSRLRIRSASRPLARLLDLVGFRHLVEEHAR